MRVDWPMAETCGRNRTAPELAEAGLKTQLPPTIAQWLPPNTLAEARYTLPLIPRLACIGGASTDAMKPPVAKVVWRVEITRPVTVFSSHRSKSM